MSNRVFIVFDTETTGLSIMNKRDLNSPAALSVRGDEVCQIGGIILDSRMVPQQLFCHFCDTIRPESKPAAYDVHGISQRLVRQYVIGQYLPEIMTRYLPEFFWEDTVFIGYNSDYDMGVVEQTLSNSAIPWAYKKQVTSLLPRRGRVAVDVAEYVRGRDYYRKLSSFSDELARERMSFLLRYEKVLPIRSNCVELLRGTWEKAHNSFFDALNTYLLWRDRIWMKKLL